MSDTIKKIRYNEFDLARLIAIICMIFVHTEFAIYNYYDESFATVFDYLGSPFAAPVFMFILGCNIVLSSRSTPNKLFIRGLSMLGVSYLFNIVCHALPFFIIDYKLGIAASVEDSLHWIFAVDILSFAGLAFMFFSIVKKYNLNNKIVFIIGVLASILNTILVTYGQIDFSSHNLLAAFTSLFYGSSSVGYFSFLGWIVFPIAGYLFMQKLQTIKNKDSFYMGVGLLSVTIYLIMVVGSFTIFKNSPLVIYTEEYSYYWMNPYQAIGNIMFCLGWISILYFICKIIPKKIHKEIGKLSSDLTNIYLIQWFVINYLLVLPFNGGLKVGKLQFIIIATFVFAFSSLLAVLNYKFMEWKQKILKN